MKKQFLIPAIGLNFVLAAQLPAKSGPEDAPRTEPATIKYVTFSADGNILAAEEDNPRNITLWDPRSARNITPYGETQPIGPLLFSADGKTLLIGDGAKINSDGELDPLKARAYEVATGKITALIGSKYALIGFSPDGKTEILKERSASPLYLLRDLASAFDETAAGKPNPLSEQHDTFTSRFHFSADSKLLAMLVRTGSPARYQVRIWEVASRKNVANLPADADDRYEFSPDRRSMAIRGTRDAHLFDTVTGKEIVTLEVTAQQIFPRGTLLLFRPDGKIVLFAVADTGGARASGRSIRACDATTGKKMVDFQKSDGSAVSAVFSADGRTVSRMFGGVVTRWNLASGAAEVFTIPTRSLKFTSAPVLSPDGSTVVGGCDDGTIKLWTVGSDSGAVKILGPIARPARHEAIPEGSKIVTEGPKGSKVFLRDAAGNMTPAPDGEYRIGARTIRVKDGRRV